LAQAASGSKAVLGRVLEAALLSAKERCAVKLSEVK